MNHNTNEDDFAEGEIDAQLAWAAMTPTEQRAEDARQGAMFLAVNGLELCTRCHTRIDGRVVAGYYGQRLHVSCTSREYAAMPWASGAGYASAIERLPADA